MDEQKNKSTCMGDVYEKHEEWREKYWQEFLEGQTTKLADWSYEEEYRLVFHELISDRSDPLTRKLQYNFSDLEGVIFGINTSEKDKCGIMKIIEAKCTKEKRQGFKFYQAYYDKHTGKIEAAELGLIKP